MGDLLPCPWCGKTDGLDIYGTLAPQIWCGNCDLYGPAGRSIDGAHAAWNTRATPKPRRDPLTDPIPSGPPFDRPIHGIAVMLNEFMEPGEMLLVCGSAAFARIKSEVPNV